MLGSWTLSLLHKYGTLNCRVRARASPVYLQAAGMLQVCGRGWRRLARFCLGATCALDQVDRESVTLENRSATLVPGYVYFPHSSILL